MKISQLTTDTELREDAWFPVARDGKNYRVSGATLRQMFAAAIHVHSANDIVSGTLNVNRIPGLTASKITSGTLAVARLATGTAGADKYLRGDGAWAAIAELLSSAAPAQEIPSGVDLNTYITPGKFAQSANAGAVAGQNYPIAQAGLLLVDTNNAAAGMVWQVYMTYQPANPQVFVRTRYSGSWSAQWLELTGRAPISHLHSAADITTGTLNVARIPSLHAALVNSGVFDAARIPSLPASRIGSGVFSRDRLGSGAASASTFLRGDGTWATPPTGAGGGGGSANMEIWYAPLSDPSLPGGGFVQFSWNDQLVMVEICLVAENLTAFAGPGVDVAVVGTTMPQAVYEFLGGSSLAMDMHQPGLYCIPLYDMIGAGATGYVNLATSSDSGQTWIGFRSATQSGPSIGGWRGSTVLARVSVA